MSTTTNNHSNLPFGYTIVIMLLGILLLVCGMKCNAQDTIKEKSVYYTTFDSIQEYYTREMLIIEERFNTESGYVIIKPENDWDYTYRNIWLDMNCLYIESCSEYRWFQIHIIVKRDYFIYYKR